MNVNCTFSEVDGWVIVAHNTKPPSVEEWAALLEFYKTRQGALRGALVYTAGGSLSAFQRKQLRNVFGNEERLVPLTAILTNSTAARLGITAFNLFIRGKVKAFDAHTPAEAMRYLEIPAEHYSAILRELRELAVSINASIPDTYRID